MFPIGENREQEIVPLSRTKDQYDAMEREKDAHCALRTD